MKPTHRLVTPIGTGEQTKWREVGAGWDNPDGSISIVLNAYVQLPNDITLRLYPWEPKKAKAEKKSTDG